MNETLIFFKIIPVSFNAPQVFLLAEAPMKPHFSYGMNLHC